MEPIKDFVSEANDEVKFTNDTIDLFRRPYQALFVYNNVKQGMNEHCMIEKNILRYCGNGFTVAGDFVMYTKKLGKYSWPIALNVNPEEPEKYEGEPAKIKGEVYLVKTETIIVLDEEYQNGLHSDRVLLPVVIPYRVVGNNDHTMKENIIHAYMYVGMPDHFEDQVKGPTFETSAFYISKNTEGLKYYNFTKKEMSE